jgi:hypothetical protein
MSTEVTTTTYVAYQCPGSFFANEYFQEVDARNPQQQAKDAPDNAFAFFYFDVVKVIVSLEGEHIETGSRRLNISKTYYIDAELFTFNQVLQLPGDYSILLDNMQRNGLGLVVRCRTGNFEPFDKDKHELVFQRANRKG